MFPFTEDYLRSLEIERRRNERRNWLRYELHGATTRTGEGEARRQLAAPANVSYSGPERRSVPCPEMKEAMSL